MGAICNVLARAIDKIHRSGALRTVGRYTMMIKWYWRSPAEGLDKSLFNAKPSIGICGDRVSNTVAVDLPRASAQTPQQQYIMIIATQ